MTERAVEFRNATVVRGGRVALHDVSLSIGVGEHVGILGPNGCGKSTLLKTIARECYPLVRPGSFVRIFGRERWNVFALRSQLGLVSSDLATALALERPARDVVLSGFFASHGVAPHHAIDASMRARADAALERTGARALAERTMTSLSSGEARRVLLARALVHEPRTLILDEPGTSLDFAAQRELRSSLSGLAREGVGIVVVTHHLADLVPEIERVVFLRAGSVIADGPRERLLQPGPLHELFGVPVEVVERAGVLQAF